jgi:hypothetical protein
MLLPLQLPIIIGHSLSPLDCTFSKRIYLNNVEYFEPDASAAVRGRRHNSPNLIVETRYRNLGGNYQESLFKRKLF